MIRDLRLKIRRSLLYMTEYPLREVVDRKSMIPLHQAIPNNLYQTWESNLFGKTHAREIEKFRDLNPELNFMLFTDEMVNEYMKNSWGSHQIYQIYLRSIFGPMKADIFRYCIIYERGGYYFDISKGCNFPLTKLHNPEDVGLITYESVDCCLFPDSDIVCSMKRPEKYVLQWGFAFTKEHPALERVIKNICENFQFFENATYEIPKNAILMLTGPGMFTKSFRETVSCNQHEGIAQTDINFNGYGVFALPRSEARYLRVPAYQHSRNGAIIRSS